MFFRARASYAFANNRPFKENRHFEVAMVVLAFTSVHDNDDNDDDNDGAKTSSPKLQYKLASIYSHKHS